MCVCVCALGWHGVARMVSVLEELRQQCFRVGKRSFKTGRLISTVYTPDPDCHTRVPAGPHSSPAHPACLFFPPLPGFLPLEASLATCSTLQVPTISLPETLLCSSDPTTSEFSPQTVLFCRSPQGRPSSYSLFQTDPVLILFMLQEAYNSISVHSVWTPHRVRPTERKPGTIKDRWNLILTKLIL